MASLVEQSLLREEDGPGNEPRYLMLETVREFGLEQLAAAGEEATTRDRHAAWCLAFAGQAPAASARLSAPTSFDRLEAEHPNLRAALAWLDQTGRLGQLLPLADQLGWFWDLAGHYREGLAWLERALAVSDEDTPARVRCEALCRVGHLAQTLERAPGGQLSGAGTGARPNDWLRGTTRQRPQCSWASWLRTGGTTRRPKSTSPPAAG